MRVMGLLKATKDTEAGVMPTLEEMQKMGAFMEEVTKAGVLLATDGLKPSAEGKRLSLSSGKTTVTDGPFSETKELIAGWALFEVKSMDEAVEWTKRFLAVLGEGECELRPIYEASDFPTDVFPPELASREEAMRADMEKNATR